MIRRSLLVMLLLALLGPGPVTERAAAEDEGSPSSVYLVFDEETGELIEVDDPNRKRMHRADQEAIESGTKPLTANKPSIDPKMTVGAGIILLLLVVTGVLYRRRHNAANN